MACASSSLESGGVLGSPRTDSPRHRYWPAASVPLGKRRTARCSCQALCGGRDKRLRCWQTYAQLSTKPRNLCQWFSSGLCFHRPCLTLLVVCCSPLRVCFPQRGAGSEKDRGGKILSCPRAET